MKKIGNKKYSLKFFAKKKNISGCLNESTNTVKVPIYYSQTIGLGELKAGAYSVEFKTAGQKVIKSFKVVKATNTNMDDLIYAPVSNAFMPEMIYSTDDAQLILSGIMQSSCLSVFDEDIKVIRKGNVFIVIPEAKMSPNTVCKSTEIPLQKIVSLGELKTPGAYLVHIRSQSGLSVNKVFQVREKEFDPTGR